MTYNPEQFGSWSRKPVKDCPIKHGVCWLNLCPYAKSGEYELVNHNITPIKTCDYPFIGRVRAIPDKVT